MARIKVVSDGWQPQVNGAVTALLETVIEFGNAGRCVTVIEPGQFPTWPCPTDPEIPLARTSRREMMALTKRPDPEFVLIAVEGPRDGRAADECSRKGS